MRTSASAVGFSRSSKSLTIFSNKAKNLRFFRKNVNETLLAFRILGFAGQRRVALLEEDRHLVELRLELEDTFTQAPSKGVVRVRRPLRARIVERSNPPKFERLGEERLGVAPRFVQNAALPPA